MEFNSAFKGSKHTDTSNNNNNYNNTDDAQAHTIFKTVQTDSKGHAVPQESPRPLRTGARFQFQVSQCGICGGQSVTENWFFFSRTSTVPCQCHFMLHTYPSFIDVVKLCTWCMTSRYTHTHGRSKTSLQSNGSLRAVNKFRQISHKQVLV
jgi:hypothetical protein